MKKLFVVLQVFLLSFKIDPFSESIVLLKLEPFSLKFGLPYFLENCPTFENKPIRK